MNLRHVHALWKGGGLEELGRVEGRWLIGRRVEAGRGGVSPRKVGEGLGMELARVEGRGAAGAGVGRVEGCLGEDWES